MEIRPYPANPDYGVTRSGRVFRITPHRGGKVYTLPHERKVPIRKDGYAMILLMERDGTERPHFVHRMVLSTFVGPAPEGHECAHKNGVRSDNRLRNLRWATRPDNNADKRLHGTQYFGVGIPNAKLTDDLVRSIRSRVAAGAVQRRIAEELSVSKATICAVVKGRVWAHV